MRGNKRFTIEKERGLYRIFDDGRLIPILDGQPICDLMNNLHDGNEQLKKENEKLKKELHKIKVVNEMLSMDFANSEHELWEENEQLKSEINMLKTTIGRNETYIKRLTHKSEWHN